MNEYNNLLRQQNDVYKKLNLSAALFVIYVRLGSRSGDSVLMVNVHLSVNSNNL